MSFILLGILNSQIDAAGGATYELLETQILTSAASSVTFTGLGSYSDYKHLQIRITARTNRANEVDFLITRFNSDTGSNYSRHNLIGDGSAVPATPSSSAVTSQARITNLFCSASTDTANSFGAGVMDILDFSSASKNTTIRLLGGVAGIDKFVQLTSGLYIDTDAITSFDFAPGIGSNLVTGSRFSLYGIRG